MNDTSGQSFLDLFGNADQPWSSANKSLPPAPLYPKVLICKKCGTEKPFSDYYVNSKGAIRRDSCKNCIQEHSRRHKRKYPDQTKDTMRQWRLNHRGKALTNVARHRAKARDLPYDLDPIEIQKRVDTGICELTGIPFSLMEPRAWNAPSLDRVDSSKGYTKENTRVVLYSVNVMMNTWGENKILQIASAISQQRSDASGRLQASLTDSLKRRLSTHGSPEYDLTWTESVMSSGPPICALRASARRTSDRGSIGWPTPTGQDNAQLQAQYATSGTTLAGAAKFLMGWATPRARDSNRGGQSHKYAGTTRFVDLPNQVRSQIGTAPLDSLNARMDRAASRLNPRFSLWLQGYPIEWARCAEAVMRSSRRLPPSS